MAYSEIVMRDLSYQIQNSVSRLTNQTVNINTGMLIINNFDE